MGKVKLIDPSKLKIQFKKSDEHKTFTATGVWGGANPQNEIVCHFFIESQAIPKNFRLKVDKDTGQITENIQDDNIFIREIQHTLVMRPDIARSVGEWLIAKADDVASFEKDISEQVANEIKKK